MNKENRSVAVIGAGNGGLALGGYAALAGADVRMYDVCSEMTRPIAEKGGIYVEGPGVNQFAPVTASKDLGQVLRGCSLVLVVTPAYAHSDAARTIAPYLEPNCAVVLNPGRTGGALEVRKVLIDCGVSQRIVVAEAQTLLFAARKIDATSVHINGVKRQVPVAALPHSATASVVSLLNQFFGQFVAANSVFETSLANIGAIFHPAPTILNAARIESHTDFDYYHEGISPAVARILERMDAERVAVAKALGISLPLAKDWLTTVYGVKGDSLYEAIQQNNAYRGIRAPKSIQVRYLFEDIPTGLVPISSFGQAARQPTPIIDAIIELGSALLGIDFRQSGRNVDSLGFAGLSFREIAAAANTL